MTEPTQKLPRLISAAALGIVLIYAVVALVARPSFGLTAFGDLAQFSLSALVTTAFAYQAHRAKGRIRLFWGLMGGGAAIWLLSQAFWSYYEVVLRIEFNNPSIQDIILFLHLVPMMAALATLPHEPRRLPAVTPYSLSMLAVWWMYLYAFIVIPWQYVYPNVDIYGPTFNFLYSTEDLAFIAGLALLAWKSSHAWRRFYSRMLLGSLGYTISAHIINVAIDKHRYYTGSYFDIPFVFSIACICWAGCTTATNLSMQESDDLEHESAASGWITRCSFLALISVPVMAAWATQASKAPLLVRNFRLTVSLVAMVTLSTLLFALQWVLSRRLRETLKTVEDSLEQLATAREALQHQATHDSMTGALNRCAITEALTRELSRASRNASTVAVLLIDLDHFKEINDRFGHHAGDIAIVAACTRMQDCVRGHDYIGRYGGEEFLAVIPETDEGLALQIAERMRGRISMNRVVFNANPILLTATIGVALSCEGDTPESLLRRADLALYSGKRFGRDNVQLATQEFRAELSAE
ncbi:MAG TPA: GGDEF domain-containing protein [Terriglobales bacterium]|nr:GGDEF domain-containing protein [Terriglobales bacterium]